MHHQYKLFRKNYVVFVALLILLVAAMLTWIAYARLQAFHQFYTDTGQESLNGVENQVSFFISEKQRIVELFAKDHIEQIRRLASNPDNDGYHEALSESIALHFPNYFAFSLTNNVGVPRFEDFDGLISDLCLSDVKKYIADKSDYHPYIHPSSEGYHFDIMIHYGKNGEEGVFLVSFLADVLSGIINNIQSSSHQIMLIMPLREDLIEVVAEGARNKWIREDYRLSVEEKSHIYMRHDIKGTRWQAIDFHNTALHSDYRNKLIAEAFLIFVVFVFIALLLVVRLRREERQRLLAEEQRKALMGMVSHEFRSPASSIRSALDFVGSGDAGVVSDKAKQFIDLAASRCTRLLILVDDFLDIQKIESGHLKFNQQKHRLDKLVTDAVEHNKLYAKQFSVIYKLIEPLAENYVFCDEARIDQVLTNLLTNAAKYGAENDTIEVALVANDNMLRVSISDHGMGIPEKFHVFVFEKFAMAYVPNKNQKVKSSGLGLSIAKAIVEQHGGTIGFDTSTDVSSGTGTTFWFELPVV